MKTFNVPIIYRSPLITAIKNRRKQQDKMKKDFSPTLLDLGALHIYLARHFGFCYGVENAIEISFRTIEENPGRRIFLLSEMIHNPQVNADLQSRGIVFLQDTYGRQLIPFGELTAEDIVIIPAFGATLEIEAQLRSIGIATEKYNTTCPFVEKVWNRSTQIAKKNYTVIVHGKPGHEETRATFSHAAADTPTIVVRDMQEAKELAAYITLTGSRFTDNKLTGNKFTDNQLPDSNLTGNPPTDHNLTDSKFTGGGQLNGSGPADDFYTRFKGQYSEGFDVSKDLQRIGVVNQTTMLASDTQAIADFLKQTMIDTYGLTELTVAERFADTRDTLCYATLDNQSAVTGLLETPADLAIVVGGYNSSNTSHLVELCEEILPTYFISSEEKIQSPQEISHYDFHHKKEQLTKDWLPGHQSNPGTSSSPRNPAASSNPPNASASPQNPSATPIRVLITSGASCPDALVESVIRKLAGYYGADASLEQMLADWS